MAIKDINQATVRGRVGGVKYFGQNNSIASISVATTYSYKDKSGGWQDITTWHRVKAFASRPGMPDLSTIEKGMVVYVTGRIVNNKFTDRDGNDREMTEIEADDIVVVDEMKPKQGNGRAPKPSRNDDDFDF